MNAKKLERALRWMADESNWMATEEVSVKRMENAGAKRGIFLYSWGVKPWILAQQALDEAETGE